MKKLLCLTALCAVTALGMLTGCGADAAQEAPASAAPSPAASASLTSVFGAGEVVDLTELSSVMVYAEVNNIMTTPDDYIGRTIRMDGLYYASYYEETGLYYHYVIVEDATACCQQGLEFMWADHIYPQDFPADDTRVEVEGVFRSYEELGITYYYVDASESHVI